VTIALRYDVDVDALMDANQIDAQDAYVLQPGQLLNVPVPASEVEAATAAETSAIRLGAPALVVPTDNAAIGCATGGMLMWQGVQFIKDSDKYVLHLGFVNGPSAGGQDNVVWILAQSAPVTQTEWELDTSLCELAPAEYDRQWRWWVEVVTEMDGRTVSISPPSVIRSFVWK
jgi:hypothetical protein